MPRINRVIDNIFSKENVLWRIKIEKIKVKIAVVTPTCVEAIDISALFTAVYKNMTETKNKEPDAKEMRKYIRFPIDISKNIGKRRTTLLKIAIQKA
jgi:hypothetical protein